MKPTPSPKKRGGARVGAGRPSNEPMESVKMPTRIMKAAREQKAAGGRPGATVSGILIGWAEAGMKSDPECYLSFQP